jgi:hypothetical protein
VWRISLVAVLLCCLSTCVLAQVPGGNVFGGYSYLNGNPEDSPRNGGMNGLEGSVEKNILPFFSLVGDVSWHYQGPGSYAVPALCSTPPPLGGCAFAAPFGVSQYTFLFGPRASVKIKDFRPFVHALVGGAHVNETAHGVAGSSTAFASAFGGGLDYRLTSRFSWRVQVDAVQTRFFSTSQTNARISSGIVVSF